jgi:putative FmdB family regulatory protein
MPTYEYKCEACQHVFEQFQSITAPPIRKCPACGRLKVRRLLGTGAGLIFKGSGFYITDYRSDSYKSAAKADGGSGSATTGTGSEAAKPAADSKPAPKSDPKPAPKKSEGK